ncbi:MAG: DUF4276 family protein [Boseongicola sp. SB0664_bin_43]|uniref:DUF4276 family protein n=1 Tax=Boseongicola sp. SB0664_bin_43 TaxID=2604844 RepID=A0A6B0Y1F6_9RHOB|nr:DUF4276 family protein [Boseongicola sp. SB0664_bin_43]
MRFEFLVEETSMEAFLEAWLRRFLPDTCAFSIHPFQGKQDLLKKLEHRLKGYAKWLPPDHRIVLVVDRDDQDCLDLKGRLEAACEASGLRSKSNDLENDWQVTIRIVIEELEAWYFGDWEAVLAVYPRVPENIPKRAPFRDPDNISGGTWERFERILQSCGYHEGGLQKVRAAQQIGAHIDVERSTSASFLHLANVLYEVAA